MKCPKCQFENAETAKFCRQCGEKLVPPADAGAKKMFCKYCGNQLIAGVKFCVKCGKPVSAASQPEPQSEPEQRRPMPQPEPQSEPEQRRPMPQPEPRPEPEQRQPMPQSEPEQRRPMPQPEPEQRRPMPQPEPRPEPEQRQPSKKLLIVIACIAGAAVLIAGAILIVLNVSKNSSETEDTELVEQTEDMEDTDADKAAVVESEDEEEESGLSDEEIKALFSPADDLAVSGKEKLDNGDYQGAVTDLQDAVSQYASIGTEHDIKEEADIYVADVYASYSSAVIAQTGNWEESNLSPDWYRQIEMVLNNAIDLGTDLEEEGYNADKTELEDNLAQLPAKYKEHYITAFNELRSGEEWSRTTAWLYMQDASSIGLVDKDNMDDPLTLRYAYALAWITQRETTEGLNDGSLSPQDVIDSILAVMEVADYNPVLIRDLAVNLTEIGETGKSEVLVNACTEVWNYLAFEENVYILPSDMLIPGKSNATASSTIELADFYYFNDFGEYSLSDTNGVSPEGRQKIRDIFKNALAEAGL